MLYVQAFGKINWTLDILGKLPNGYHSMDMLMQAVSLSDLLSFADSDTLAVSGSLHMPQNAFFSSGFAPDALRFGEDNIVAKAARLLQREYGLSRGADIHIEKHIPFGAGMGGGSADAAAALLGLNRLWHIGLDDEQLLSLGLRLGADVPFFLRGCFARVRGIGERITPLPYAPHTDLVLIKPSDGISTGKIFAEYDATAQPERRPNQPMAQEALQSGQFALLKEYGGNVFQDVVAKYIPEIEKNVQMLYALGAAYAAMTGSGCVVFGVFGSHGEAARAVALLKKDNPCVWQVETQNQALHIETIP